jgi:hypothetical protein
MFLVLDQSQAFQHQYLQAIVHCHRLLLQI